MNKLDINYLSKKLDLIIFDECQDISGEVIHGVMKCFKIKNIPLIGFSATPFRPSHDGYLHYKEIFDNNIIAERSYKARLKCILQIF